MTNETGKNIPGIGGQERPQVTLDLTATETRSGSSSEPEKPGAAADHTTEPQPQLSVSTPEPEPGSPEDGAAPPRLARMSDTNMQSFVTHMTAGVLGGLFALIIAYYAAAGFRDYLPLLTERSAQDFLAQVKKQDERFAALENAVNAPRPDTSQLQARIQTIGEQVASLKLDVAAIGRRLEERTGSAAGSVSTEAAQHDLEPLKAKLAELEGRLAQVATAQTQVETNSKASALAVALNSLHQAADEGRPYAAELQTLAAMSPAPLDLSALQARSEQGVRTLKQLQNTFNAAANAAIDAESATHSGSWASEVWNKAKSLVRIRRKGDVPGEDTQAVLARTEGRLNAGDLRGSIREAGQLKGAAATAFKPWLDEAQARIATDEALARVDATLLAALGSEHRGKGGS